MSNYETITVANNAFNISVDETYPEIIGTENRGVVFFGDDFFNDQDDHITVTFSGNSFSGYYDSPIGLYYWRGLYPSRDDVFTFVNSTGNTIEPGTSFINVCFGYDSNRKTEIGWAGSFEIDGVIYSQENCE